MSVDEELLARQDNSDTDNSEEADSDNGVAEFNASKREDLNKQKEQEEPSQPKSLREAVQMAKAQKTNSLKGKITSGKPNALSMGTAQLLKVAWQNLISTWGLSLLWINAHLCLSAIFGKEAFCALGEEWTMKKGGASGKALSKALRLLEPMGLGLLNLGCLAILIGLAVLISLIASAISEPLKTIWNLVGDLLKDFWDLF